MARRRKPEAEAKAPETPPAPSTVRVVIRAGHSHRDVRYTQDTGYEATPEEVELLRQYGALVEP